MQEAIDTTLAEHADGGAARGGLLGTLSAASGHVALLAAWLAACGSLFFSEVIGWLPCELCWFQRIFMYPLAFIVAIGILRRDRGMYLYVLPLSLIGGAISMYHYLLIKTSLFPAPPCKSGVSCTVDYLDWFGFINIPFMALTAFSIITVMMIIMALVPRPADALAEDDVLEDAGAAPALALADIGVFAIIAAVLVAFVVGSRLV